jgi:hypothetical protein
VRAHSAVLSVALLCVAGSASEDEVLYPLAEILLLMLCATIAGADDFVEIGLWGNEHQDFLSRFLPYDRCIPSHDTLCDVIAAIDPELFETCFLAWAEALRADIPEVIAIDGKTSRRSHDRRKGCLPLHTVSAWATSQRLVLGQETVAEKSNEISTSFVAGSLGIGRCIGDHRRDGDSKGGGENGDHGRIETRRHIMCHTVDWAVLGPAGTNQLAFWYA